MTDTQVLENQSRFIREIETTSPENITNTIESAFYEIMNNKHKPVEFSSLLLLVMDGRTTPGD